MKNEQGMNIMVKVDISVQPNQPVSTNGGTNEDGGIFPSPAIFNIQHGIKKQI